MSKSCKFTKNGLMAVRWSEETEREEDYVPEHVFDLLVTGCEIDDDVTLLDLFLAVEKYPELMAFMGAYSWCGAIKEFHQQIRLPAEKDSDYSGDEYLEVYRSGQIHTFEGVDELSSGVGFHMIDPDSESRQWSVSSTPLNKLAHMPIRVNCDYEIYKMPGPIEPLLKLKHYWSLLEVLHAIYWDISFHGGPGDNQKFLNDIAETVERIRNGTEPLVEDDGNWQDFFVDGTR